MPGGACCGQSGSSGGASGGQTAVTVVDQPERIGRRSRFAMPLAATHYTSLVDEVPTCQRLSHHGQEGGNASADPQGFVVRCTVTKNPLKAVVPRVVRAVAQAAHRMDGSSLGNRWHRDPSAAASTPTGVAIP